MHASVTEKRRKKKILVYLEAIHHSLNAEWFENLSLYSKHLYKVT